MNEIAINMITWLILLIGKYTPVNGSNTDKLNLNVWLLVHWEEGNKIVYRVTIWIKIRCTLNGVHKSSDVFLRCLFHIKFVTCISGNVMWTAHDVDINTIIISGLCFCLFQFSSIPKQWTQVNLEASFNAGNNKEWNVWDHFSWNQTKSKNKQHSAFLHQLQQGANAHPPTHCTYLSCYGWHQRNKSSTKQALQNLKCLDKQTIWRICLDCQPVRLHLDPAFSEQNFSRYDGIFLKVVP